MATFYIRRLRDSAQDKFRWAPQQSTAAILLKPSDYSEDGEIDAQSTYEAWLLLRKSNRELRVGDVLVDAKGGVEICKYAGFEPAEWIVADNGQQLLDGEYVAAMPKDHNA
ncbi:MAG: hypothetical protein KIT83_18725 [Bryobacterales bacterium]|nr:hypothetical protein [Bryobacterales bacterium]